MSERTPDHRARRAAQLRVEFDAALKRAREVGELQDADEFPDESSVRIEGEPKDVAEFLATVRAQQGLRTRIVESIAPISRRMNSPRGRIAAIVTGGLALIGGALRFISWLEEQGLLR